MDTIIDRRKFTNEAGQEGHIEIVKVGNSGKKHAVVAYVVRENIGGLVKPIPNPNAKNEQETNLCYSLLEARKLAGLEKAVAAPKETKPKKAYAQYTGTSRTR